MSCHARARVILQAMWTSIVLFQVCLAKLGTEYYHFSECGDNMVLKPEYRSRQVTSPTSLHCGMVCRSDATCKSFDFHPTQLTCQLGTVKTQPGQCDHLAQELGGPLHFTQGPQCLNGQILQADMTTCKCPVAHNGPGCVKTQDCTDYGEDLTDSIQWIWPNTSAAPFQVSCSVVTGKLRTVLMSRQEGDVDFQTKNWSDYTLGFGNLSADHWLGLSYMHLLTDNRFYKLKFRVRLGGEQSPHYLTYNDVHIADESANFQLTFFQNSESTTKNQQGILADCLDPDQQERQFSTYDGSHDNDGLNDVDCAGDFGGSGWWFNAESGCSACNPTGDMRQSLNGSHDWVSSGLDRREEMFWNSSLAIEVAPTDILMYLLP